MKESKNNYAFIDSQNLNFSIRELGWLLDFNKFSSLLRKFAADMVFMNDLKGKLAYIK